MRGKFQMSKRCREAGGKEKSTDATGSGRPRSEIVRLFFAFARQHFAYRLLREQSEAAARLGDPQSTEKNFND
jgi:hypothetical protein